METWRTEWVRRKSEIALKLEAGQYGGGYGEAALILCATLSALAAEIWPGEGIDRVRFVQLLTDFAPERLQVTRVSIPLLVAHLRAKQQHGDSTVIRRTFLHDDDDPSRILTGDDIDTSEGEIRRVYPVLSLKVLRDQSYAHLLYREVRSPYIHEGRPGKHAASWPLTQRQEVAVSYFNETDKPHRQIHFHLRWMSKLACAVAQAVDAAASDVPQPPPHQWWISG
jgi:hypothetical protein